jgi:D-glycero-alpha-D-manno-heptose 1-phosphate guanylyltransferase
MLSSFDTIILAGGLGSRLQGVVSDRPKCLAEINGRPFLAYLLEQLERAGMRDVILSTGYMAGKVEAEFGPRHGSIALRYSREAKPLGTGGAVKEALALGRHDHALVLNGDSYFDFDWPDFLGGFDPASMPLAMAMAWMEDSRRFGQVTIGADGRVLGFQEKSEAARSGWINAGIYMIQRELLAQFEVGESFSLEHDFFPAQIGRGFFARGYHGRFIDIGTPESYRAAEEFFRE